MGRVAALAARWHLPALAVERKLARRRPPIAEPLRPILLGEFMRQGRVLRPFPAAVATLTVSSSALCGQQIVVGNVPVGKGKHDRGKATRAIVG